MDAVEVILKRLDLLENAVFSLCEIAAAPTPEADNVGRNLAQHLTTLRTEFLTSQQKPTLVVVGSNPPPQQR